MARDEETDLTSSMQIMRDGIFLSGDFFFGIPDVDSDSFLSLLFLSLSLLLMCGALITPRFHAASLLSLAVSFSSRRSLVNRNFPQVISG